MSVVFQAILKVQPGLRTTAIDLQAVLIFLAKPIASQAARTAPAGVHWLRGGRWTRPRAPRGDVWSHTPQAGRGVLIVGTNVAA